MAPNEDKTSSSEQVAEEQGAVAKPEAPAESPKAPEAPKSDGSPISERTRTIVVGVLAALFLIFALVQTVSLNSARNDLAEARTLHSTAQAELKQESQRQQALFTATSLAWGLKPAYGVLGRVPEVNNRTLQTLCEEMVQDKRFRLIAFLDGSHNVLASTNLALINTPYPGVTPLRASLEVRDDFLEVQAPIASGNTLLGTVVLQIDAKELRGP